MKVLYRTSDSKIKNLYLFSDLRLVKTELRKTRERERERIRGNLGHLGIVKYVFGAHQ